MPGDLPVILSAAKDLCVRRASPFAEFTLSEANGLRVTGVRSKYLVEVPLNVNYVIAML